SGSFATCGAPSTFVTGYGPDYYPTLYFTNGQATFAVHTAPNYQAGADGDYGPDNLPNSNSVSNYGFYHQELINGGVSNPSVSQQFLLPAGAMCGFHHNLNTRYPPGTTLGSCMNFDPSNGPNNGCPAGWSVESQPDARSPGGAWSWCQY